MSNLHGRLFDLFLDSDRQYSCAYFDAPDTPLDDAQAAKKRHIIAKLYVEPGQSVLACRERRPAGAILVDRPEPRLEEAPVDRSRQPPEGMVRIDDLVEPGSERISLARLSPSLGRMQAPLVILTETWTQIHVG